MGPASQRRGATGGRPSLARSSCGASRMHDASRFPGTRCSRFRATTLRRRIRRRGFVVHASSPRIFTTMFVARVPGCLCSGPHEPQNANSRCRRRSRPHVEAPRGRMARYPMQIGVRNGMSVKVLRPDSTFRMRRLPPTRSRIPAFAQGSCGRDPIRERHYDNGIENIVSIGFLAEVMQRIGCSYAGILTIVSSPKRIRRIPGDARKSSRPRAGSTCSMGCSPR